MQRKEKKTRQQTQRTVRQISCETVCRSETSIPRAARCRITKTNLELKCPKQATCKSSCLFSSQKSGENWTYRRSVWHSACCIANGFNRQQHYREEVSRLFGWFSVFKNEKLFVVSASCNPQNGCVYVQSLMKNRNTSSAWLATVQCAQDPHSADHAISRPTCGSSYPLHTVSVTVSITPSRIRRRSKRRLLYRNDVLKEAVRRI